jgi:hypothetical protein
MKKYLFSAILFSISLIAFSSDIKDIMPAQSGKWKISDSVRVFAGDELFTYIDGGAEIFIEYGFVKVATVNYANPANEQLQAEIYEMADSAAAYGAYTFYLNGEGKPLKVGLSGMFIDYYAVFVKGNYLVVLSASNSSASLYNDCAMLSETIAKKINANYSKPLLVSTIEKSGIASGYIKYLEGNIGLSNVYKFIPGKAFSFKEAVSFKSDQSLIILMKFADKETAVANLNSALEKMKDANKETTFSKTEDGFNFIDYKPNFISVSDYKNFIVIFIASSKEIAEQGKLRIIKVL